jgi:hypothetical protein
MFSAHEVEPGTAAPFTGTYELCHVLGGSTGATIEAVAGERLPVGPRGWFWAAMTRGTPVDGQPVTGTG